MRGWSNTFDRVMDRYVWKTESCWIWMGELEHGYGRTRIKHKRYQAHRFIYETIKGPLSKDLTLDHLCRNRCCVNPLHLEPVDVKTNVLRGIGISAQNARKTHCLRDHELSGDNLIINKAGERQCRVCTNFRAVRQYHKDKARPCP